MNIILLQDVKSLGKKGELVKVNDGYARNYIIPKKLGVEATAKNINDLKLQKANEEKKAQQLLEEAQKFAEFIKEKPVSIKIRVGESGKVFGSVSTKEIAAAFKEQHDIDIDKKKLLLDEPIKALGTVGVDYKAHQKVTAKLTINVVEE